jgi:hypothetical protein
MTCSACECVSTQVGADQQRPTVVSVSAALHSPTEEWCSSFDPDHYPWLKGDAVSPGYLGGCPAASSPEASSPEASSPAASSQAAAPGSGALAAESPSTPCYPSTESTTGSANSSTRTLDGTDTAVMPESTGAAQGLAPFLTLFTAASALAFALL